MLLLFCHTRIFKSPLCYIGNLCIYHFNQKRTNNIYFWHLFVSVLRCNLRSLKRFHSLVKTFVGQKRSILTFIGFNLIHDGLRDKNSLPPPPCQFFWLLVLILLPHWVKPSRPYLVSMPNYWTWTNTVPQNNGFFWSNSYKIEFIIASLLEMPELPGFGHMTRSTIQFETRDKFSLVTLWTEMVNF